MSRKLAVGVFIVAVSSAVSPRQVSSIRIDTQHATVTVDHLYGHGHENWRITPAPHVSEARAAGWALPEHEERSGHTTLLRDVFDALLSGSPLPATADEKARSLEMVAAIYRDTDPRLHGAAGLSVLAHLEDLVARGLARSEGPVAIDGVFAPA